MSEIVKKAVLGSVGAAGLFLASGAVVNASDVHTVVSNDTVWSLAHKYGVSQHTLEKQNNIDPQTHTIYQGQKLTIATNNEVSSKTVTSGNGNYTVQAGDSLWTIARNAGITVAQLREANGLDLNSSVIQPGQILQVNKAQTSSAQQTTHVTVSVNKQASSQAAAAVVQQKPAAKTVPVQTPTVSDNSAAQSTTQLDKNETPSITQNNGNAPASSQAVTPQVSASTKEVQQPAGDPQPVEKKVVNKSENSQPTASAQNSVQPVQKKAVVSQPQTSVIQTQVTDEAAAKEWIAQKESGGSYTVTNGQYYGRYQLTSSYLHNDFSSANQEKVAQEYVTSVYGSWNNAKSFWSENGWY